MNSINPWLLQGALSNAMAGATSEAGRYTMAAAEHLYRTARRRRWLGKIRAIWQRRPNRPLSLSHVAAQCQVRQRRVQGLRSVPLPQIRGSEGRCGDFDANFMPLKVHNRQRWLSVALAWYGAQRLPPVELIQIGDIYFVRDGHHRVSVAQARGQKEIEAVVTEWQIAAPTLAPTALSLSRGAAVVEICR